MHAKYRSVAEWPVVMRSISICTQFPCSVHQARLAPDDDRMPCTLNHSIILTEPGRQLFVHIAKLVVDSVGAIDA
jgi:hypothetical protein